MIDPAMRIKEKFIFGYDFAQKYFKEYIVPEGTTLDTENAAMLMTGADTPKDAAYEIQRRIIDKMIISGFVPPSVDINIKVLSAFGSGFHAGLAKLQGVSKQ